MITRLEFAGSIAAEHTHHDRSVGGTPKICAGRFATATAAGGAAAPSTRQSVGPAPRT
jgi:hypothetical protein